MLEGIEKELATLPLDLAQSGTAAVARAMAERIDGGRGSPSECGKVLLHALETLRALAPPKKEADKLDDLAERRAKRIAARGANTTDLSRS